MNPYGYAHEKLSSAVRILATGEGEVRSRLWHAFLEFHTLQASNFPPSLQDDYNGIVNALTKRKPKNDVDQREWATDGDVKANLRRMINRTGSQIAEKICDLEHHVQIAYDEWYQNLRKSQE